MEGPLRPWQFLVYVDASPPPYVEDLPPLHHTGPSHTLLQIGPYFEDLEGELGEGVAREGGEVEIERESRDASVEL